MASVQQRLVTIELQSDMGETVNEWLEDELRAGWRIVSVTATGTSPPAAKKGFYAEAYAWLAVVLERPAHQTR